MLSYPNIDPVAIAVGPLEIHWYGLTYLGARDQVDDLIFYAALGIVLGGRIGYSLFYGWSQVMEDPTWLLRVWQGGMSFHGGLLGVIIAMFVFAKRRGIAFGALLDFIAPLAPVGLGLGRLGNFIGQELWGRATDVPWAMVFPRDPLQLPRHPSQLYQFALEGVLLFIVLVWFTSRPRPNWSAAGLFGVAYGCLRFFVEFFREPDMHIGFQAFGWMTRGQLLCIPMILAGLAMMVWAYRQAGNTQQQPGN